MFSFSNSPLILLVTCSIYNTFVEKENDTRYVTKTLDAKKIPCLSSQVWEVVATTKSPTLQVRHVKMKFKTLQAIKKKKTCDWFINYSLDLFVNS
jgi:hypothetical protein